MSVKIISRLIINSRTTHDEHTAVLSQSKEQGCCTVLEVRSSAHNLGIGASITVSTN